MPTTVNVLALDANNHIVPNYTGRSRSRSTTMPQPRCRRVIRSRRRITATLHSRLRSTRRVLKRSRSPILEHRILAPLRRTYFRAPVGPAVLGFHAAIDSRRRAGAKYSSCPWMPAGIRSRTTVAPSVSAAATRRGPAGQLHVRGLSQSGRIPRLRGDVRDHGPSNADGDRHQRWRDHRVRPRSTLRRLSWPLRSRSTPRKTHLSACPL